MEFHPSQKEAVFHERGPAFVLAGPGSGKTRVLTGRIQYLVKERHVPPERILVVTFSRAAAVEMEERFQSLYEGGVGPCFGTFHSAFFRIVSESAREKLSIMAPERQAGLLADILKQLGREEYLERDFLKGVLRDISRLKTWEIPLEDFMPDVMSKEIFQPLYEIYERQKERQGLMDFDDILIRCKKLLTGNPQVLFLWRSRYDYILVDEFQDASRLQYELICLLAAPDYPVFFVGDDDQAIYGFRGAAPQLMSRAAQELPGCRVIRLNINFRSREPIIKGAARLISHNKDRFDKHIKGSRGGGEPVCFQEFENERDQARAAAAYFSNMGEEEQGAVLFRTRRLMKPFKEAFLEQKVPFWRGEPSEAPPLHWADEDMLCYLRLGSGIWDRSILLKICNKPFRGISREMLREIEQMRGQKTEGYQNGLKLFLEQISMLQSLPPFGQIQYIRTVMGYEDYARKHSREENEPGEALFRLEQLQKKSIPFRKTKEFFLFLKKEREEILKTAGESCRKGISFLTIHGAKGLEFDRVWLPDWNDGILPHKRKNQMRTKEDVEEERRLAYVGVTRAKDRLVVSWVKNRYGKEQERSPFVEELRKGQ